MAAFFFPAAASAAKTLFAESATAISTPVNNAQRNIEPQARRATALPWPRGQLFAVGDAIDRTGKIVRDQQRAVTQLRESNRPADIFAIRVQPAFSKYLLRPGGAVIGDPREQYPRNHGNGTV